MIREKTVYFIYVGVSTGRLVLGIVLPDGYRGLEK
jgi:hypothetical protein